ncbi:MAG: response regulator [Pseudomonadales bacterium]|nr:response regulator [Pseudomonadales bacterium]
MNFTAFAESYLIPHDRRNDRFTRLFVYLCSAATITAFVAAAMTWFYGYPTLGGQIGLAALTIPVAFLLLRISPMPQLAGHYLATNIFIQTLLFAADPAVGVITLIAVAAAAPLLGKTAGQFWLAVVVARAIWVAITSEVEIAALIAVAVFVVVTVTERSREQALRRARTSQRTSTSQVNMLRDLVSKYFDALITLDGPQIVFTSSGITKLLGYTSDQLTSRSLDDFLHPDEPNANHIIGIDMAARRLELRLRHADGRWLWVEAYIAPDIVKQSAHNRYLILRSFEQEKKVGDQLFQAQRLESMGTMAAAVAHDFNNMLTVVLGQADDLPDGPIKTEITRVTGRAASLTGKLLTFGHGQRTSEAIVDLSYLMREQSDLLQHALNRSFMLIEEYQKEPMLVRISESQFEQVLVNLVNNARESMPDGGELEVALRGVEIEHGHFARLEVRDTGQGMDEETKNRVFDPFFSTKERTHSSGLGLSSCYGIIHQIGGHIEVETEKNVGTSFKVYFPIAEMLDHEPQLEVIDNQASVVVVDDDPAVLGVIRNALLKAGHSVRAFTEPEAAIEFFNRSNTSVLVTDVIMPGTSGSNLAAKLRSQAPNLPILFISGFTNAELDHWQTDERTLFLAKPFRGTEVVQRVELLLGTLPPNAVQDELFAHI